MKKVKRQFILLLSIFIVFLSFNNVAYARGESITINKFDSKVEVQSNGDLKITELLEMAFDGKFNGMYRELSWKKTSGIKDLAVYSVDSHGKEDEFELVQEAENGDEGVYIIKDTGAEKCTIKLYTPSKNTTRIFKITYTLLSGGITNEDCSEVYYNFWNRDYNDIGKFTGTIVLPEEVDFNNIKAFYEGANNINITKIDNKTIEFSKDKVRKRDFLSGRVIVPKGLINSLNITNKTMESILNEENSKIIKRNEKMKSTEFAKKIIEGIDFVNLAIFIIFFIIYMKKRRKILEEVLGSAELEAKPYYVNSLMYVSENRVFPATILDLAARGFLDINKETVINKKGKSEEDYKIFIKSISSYDLEKSEKFFLENLLKLSNNTGELSLLSLKDKSEETRMFTMEWLKIVKEELKNKGYYEENFKKVGAKSILCSVFSGILFIVNIVFGAVNDMLGLGIFLGGVTTLLWIILSIVFYSQLSKKGYEQKQILKKIYNKVTSSNVELALFNYDMNKLFPILIAMGLSNATLKKISPYILSNADEEVLGRILKCVEMDNFVSNGSFVYFCGHSAAASSISGGTGGTGGGGCGGGGAGGF